jgi:hypothetical protein
MTTKRFEHSKFTDVNWDENHYEQCQREIREALQGELREELLRAQADWQKAMRKKA